MHGRAHGSRHGERGGRTAVPLHACKCACERGPRAAGGGRMAVTHPPPGVCFGPAPPWPSPAQALAAPHCAAGPAGPSPATGSGFQRGIYTRPQPCCGQGKQSWGGQDGGAGGNGDEDGAAGSSQAGSWGAGLEEREDEDEDEGGHQEAPGGCGCPGLGGGWDAWPWRHHSGGTDLAVWQLGATAAGSPARCSHSPSPALATTARHWVENGSAPAQAAATQSRARQGGGGRRRAGPAQLDPSDVERKSPRVSKPALEWGQDAPGPRKQSTERLRGRPHGQVES